ncbi:hypothetical protein Cch01nite_20750 [Cellulomonas chitinilytica]|uniref:DUF2510 domain-containing protein n=1 Tax=Cellulomonas chitinilytica TaxID=398759 RepID=A0A919U1F9_9CELL|nr:DUF2510 domain-containing protein [Cellulomonas chitinilytica]GIG21351.1 hypothetical protein Cch01nite_20750 [Cellulomonas chitinilytica]
MTAVPPGWYPDPENPTTTRWYDGQAWTEHRGPAAPVPTPPPAAFAAAPPGAYALAWGTPPAPVARGRSPLTVALIVVGCVMGGLFVVGILAAIAIPVFLNQKVKAELAELSTVTCESIAAEAVTRSQTEVTGTDVPLTSLSGLTVTDDHRANVQRPHPDGLSPVLTCTGTALWADGVTTPATVELHVDSAWQHQVSVDWDE